MENKGLSELLDNINYSTIHKVNALGDVGLGTICLTHGDYRLAAAFYTMGTIFGISAYMHSKSE